MLNHQESDLSEESEMYQECRNLNFETADMKMSGHNTDHNITKQRYARCAVETAERCKYLLHQKSIVRDHFKNVLEELDIVSFIPPGKSTLPVLKNGGWNYLEWKKELTELVG